jgi:hypothetical protein
LRKKLPHIPLTRLVESFLSASRLCPSALTTPDAVVGACAEPAALSLALALALVRGCHNPTRPITTVSPNVVRQRRRVLSSARDRNARVGTPLLGCDAANSPVFSCSNLALLVSHVITRIFPPPVNARAVLTIGRKNPYNYFFSYLPPRPTSSTEHYSHSITHTNMSLEALPTELDVLILDYLGTQDVSRLTRVSEYWRRI